MTSAQFKPLRKPDLKKRAVIVCYDRIQEVVSACRIKGGLLVTKAMAGVFDFDLESEDLSDPEEVAGDEDEEFEFTGIEPDLSGDCFGHHCEYL
ncbi:ribosomal protein S6 kinase beta-2-like [Huso huso]|uniref:Ribosomal protein S6 kinase beta-2-like n=1 Tax=Huso huso TaxID=61971 RepID=A0ABR0Y7G5_HUSHU